MNGRFRDYAHLLRMAALFGIGILGFFAARAMFVPGDFGVYGFYRAGAIEDNRERTLKFAGREACADCHDDIVAKRAGSAHERVGCEACHGALHAHAEDPAAVTPQRPEGASICQMCHRASASRPEWFPQVDAEEHSMGQACNACHDPHHPGFE